MMDYPPCVCGYPAWWRSSGIIDQGYWICSLGQHYHTHVISPGLHFSYRNLLGVGGSQRGGGGRRLQRYRRGEEQIESIGKRERGSRAALAEAQKMKMMIE